MNAEEVRTFADRATATWNRHDRAGYVALYTDDQVSTAPGGIRLEGRAGAEMFYDVWQNAFPDNRIEVKSIVADEGSACIEALFTGTHTGALITGAGEVPATGARVAVPFVHLISVRNGKTAYGRLYFDTAELATQLGLMQPAAAEA